MLGHRKLEVVDYLGIFKRRRALIALCLFIFPVAAIIVTRFIPPRYMSQTLVLIEEQKVPDEYVKPVIASNLDGRLASMKEQILSRSRIQPIIEKYHLYDGSRSTMDDRVDLARKSIDIKPIHSAIANTGGLPGFFITFTSSDAHTAQLVCGEITTLFMNENLRSREASAEGTTDFLKGQLADAKRSLDEQDTKLAAFQTQYFGKLPGEEAGNMQMLTSLNTQLEAANQALARMEQDKTYLESMLAQQQQAYASARAAYTASASSASGATDAATPAQQKELTNLQQKEAELTSQYTPSHPDVITVRRQIADLKKEIAKASVPAAPAAAGETKPAVTIDPLPIQQIRSQLKAADTGIQEKRREQSAIQARLGTYQERLQSSPQVEEQYKQLTRDYNTAQKFYDDLLTKMNHSKMATDLERRQEGEQFRVMDEPNLPDSPSFPKLWLFALGGLALGVAVGTALAAFLEYKDTSLRNERDVWAFTRLPTLGVISVAGIFPEDAPKPRFFSRFKPGPKVKPANDALASANG